MTKPSDGVLDVHSNQRLIFDHEHSQSRRTIIHREVVSEASAERTRPMSSVNGTEIWHRTPASRNSRFTLAFSPLTRLSSMSFVPKPRREGGATGGPAVSSHIISSSDFPF